MNIIFVTRSHGKAHTFQLGNRWLALIGLGMALVFGTVFLLGYWQARGSDEVLAREGYIQQWQDQLQAYQQNITDLKQMSDEEMQQLSIRLAELHARLIRLDALGEFLVTSADLDAEEFNFSENPAVGGPLTSESSFDALAFLQNLENFDDEIASREDKLELLNRLLGDKAFEDDRYIAGRPVTWGWLSSNFGKRTDPFSGNLAWHMGVDFAGKENSDVVAVAAGVVTWAGERSGYGNMVEINHGGSMATRYAHANDVLVSVGDVVEKGQVVALMGSTGRSTGPHVHFEVLKNGTQVDPARYVKRTN